MYIILDRRKKSGCSSSMSRIVLDTHVLLWTIYDQRRLAPDAAEAIEDPANEVLFSAVAIWEIAGFAELPVTAAAAAQVSALPPIHKDPFDRLLVAQAINEPARLLTADRILAQYSTLVQPFDPL